jgi:hypothetical protein
MARNYLPLLAPSRGVNFKKAPSELEGDEAYALDNALIDRQGLVRRRDGWDKIGTGLDAATFDNQQPAASGTMSDPASSDQHGWIYTHDPGGNSDAVLARITAAGVATVQETSDWKSVSNPFWTEIRASLQGKLTLSIMQRKSSSTQDQSDGYGLYQLLGCSVDVNPLSTDGTTTCQIGTTTVAGDTGAEFLDETEVGAVIVDENDSFCGIVKSITSDTALELERGSLVELSTNSAGCHSYVGFVPWHGKGRITCSTTDATVTGSNTKFELFNKAYTVTDWRLHRRSDWANIALVQTVTNNESLELTTSTPAIAMNNEEYIAIPENADIPAAGTMGTATAADNASRPWLGCLGATFAGRQFIANNPIPREATGFFSDTYLGSRVSFSSLDLWNDVDWSDDGDWFDIGGIGTEQEPILTMWPTRNALIIFKPSSVWAITGNHPGNFRADPIHTDGLWDPNAVTSFRGGVAWIGKEGVWAFDGTNAPVNLIKDTIGSELWASWQSGALDGLDSQATRKYASIYENGGHLFVSIQGMDTDKMRWISQGDYSVNPSTRTFVINLETGALSTWYNSAFACSTTIDGKLYGFGLQRDDAAAGSTLNPVMVDLDSCFTEGKRRDEMILDSTYKENPVGNSSFETNTTGWSTGGTNSLAASADQAKFGSQSLKVTYGNSTELCTSPALTITNAVASVASIWLYIPTAWDGGAITFGDHGTMGSAAGGSVSADMTKKDQWQYLEFTITPAGDPTGTYGLLSSGTTPTATRFIYVDGFGSYSGITHEGSNIDQNGAPRHILADGTLARTGARSQPFFYFASGAISLTDHAQQLVNWLGLRIEYQADLTALVLDAFTGRQDEQDTGKDAPDSNREVANSLTAAPVNKAGGGPYVDIVALSNDTWQNRDVTFPLLSDWAGRTGLVDQYFRYRLYDADESVAGTVALGQMGLWFRTVGDSPRRK